MRWSPSTGVLRSFSVHALALGSLRALILASMASMAASAATAQQPAPPPAEPQQGDTQQGAGKQGDAQRPTWGNRQSEGLNREQMWPAPTAEDWQKPVRIQWQRSWADAVAVSKATGKPILVCVNMDGEPASEHYAGIRYRDPEIAKLYEKYVCVIASVYRHNPSDYDENGNRIPCPRFGCVTCGEHIEIEPLLFEKFMDGRRIAPRHIMVELDGSETFDVMLTWDTASVFDKIHDGIAQRDPNLVKEVRGDRTIFEKVASREATDREAVEKAFRTGDPELRQKLLEAARTHKDAAPIDLLRLGLFSLDSEMNRAARTALIETESPQAVDLISEALRAQLPREEREQLVETLTRLGKVSSKAQTLAVVHRGMSNRSEAVDVERWAEAVAGASYPAPVTKGELRTEITEIDAKVAKRPEDPSALLELAKSSLAIGLHPETEPKWVRPHLIDAETSALQAEEHGAKGWSVDATIAIAQWYLGKKEDSFVRAQRAMQNLPEEPTSWNSMAVLDIFVQAQRDKIRKAYIAKQPWPQELMTDVHATYSVLAKHPFGTALHIVDHYDFIRFFGAFRQAEQVLQNGLERFPTDPQLHERLRRSLLRRSGMDGLERHYAQWLEKEDAPEQLEWFAGYASIVAAEFWRRRGRFEAANDAYARAIGYFERNSTKYPASQETGDHWIAMALAGQGRIAMEEGRLEDAVAKTIAAFEKKQDAADDLDSLNMSAVTNARQIITKARDSGQGELAQKLQAALQALPPELLRMPEFENVGQPGQRPGGQRPGAGQQSGQQSGQQGERRR